MTVLFDAVTGRLRLSVDSWDALCQWGAGRSPHGQQTEALHDAGVIEQGRPHPSLAPALGAALAPLVRLTIGQCDHEGRHIDGSGWVTPGAAALLLDAPDDLRELVTVHPAMLAATLARVVALGPRGRGETLSLHVPDDVASPLLGPDVQRRRTVALEFGADRLPDLVDGPWNHWNIEARWDPDTRRVITVLDTPHQMWLVERAFGVHVLWPTNPTQVWRLLTRLLPGDDELSFAPDDEP